MINMRRLESNIVGGSEKKSRVIHGISVVLSKGC